MLVGLFLRGAVLLAATVLVAGCGSSDGQSSEDAAASGSPASDGAFPVTVETAFGPVEIAEEPQRVVALGWSDAETALALGVQPVGPVTGWASAARASARGPRGATTRRRRSSRRSSRASRRSPRCSPT